MKNWLPFPFSSSALLLLWLMINQTLAPGHILLGIMLAVYLPLFTRRLQPLGDPKPAKPLVLLKLIVMSLIEIARSCFNVSSIILLGRGQQVRSRFIRIPLDIKNPYGLALLSCILNTTPGTVWVEIRPGSHELTLHVFDLHDQQWWIDTIKTQYEKPLIAIFESE